LAVAANGGPIKRPSDGKEVSSVVFVQCAGQRSQKQGHLPYCSVHCCLTSIKQAMYFKDSNPKIDTGIYTTGPVRRPMDMQQAQEGATGAALKAVQAIENAGLGRAAHPRSGDLYFPLFRREGSTQCKCCTVECPFGAIDEDEERYPKSNESRCRRCGTCMGACPVRVISFENYSVGQQLKAVDIPDEFDEKPRILVSACENDAYNGALNHEHKSECRCG